MQEQEEISCLQSACLDAHDQEVEVEYSLPSYFPLGPNS